MSHNSLAPGFVKLKYGTISQPHELVLGVQPAPGPITPGVEPQFLKRDGTSIAMTTAMQAFVNLLKPMFNTVDEFQVADFWSKPTPSSDPVFIYSSNVTASGTSTTTKKVDQQLVLTFRTYFGGIKRLYLMESIFGAETAELAPFQQVLIKALSDFLVSTASWVYARDNSYPFVPLKALGKTNDELRRRRLNL